MPPPEHGREGPGKESDRSAVPSLAVHDLQVELRRPPSGALSSQRLGGLLAANRSIIGELSLPKVLERIVEAARDVAGARCAALGVRAPDGGLDPLLTSGSEDDVAALRAAFTGTDPTGGPAAPPSGARTPGSPAGDQDTPGRLGGDQSRVGPVLAVPVRAHGSVYGDLWVAAPVTGGSFTPEDEELVVALAATAGIAIENAGLHDESRRRREWLLASSEISQRLLVTHDDELEVWRLIADDVRHLAAAEVVALVVPLAEDEHQFRVAVAVGTGERELEGTVHPGLGSVAHAAVTRGRGSVVDGGEPLPFLGGPDEPAGPMMAVPLKGEWGSRGAIVVARPWGQPSFTPADVDMAEDFASQAAAAVELAEARSAQQRVADLEERERIARDLHDHVIQRLFATGLSLRSAAGTVGSPVIRGRLDRSVAELDETIRQIRTSIFALRYSRPTASSLRATVLSVVEEVTPTLGFRPATRFSGPLDLFVEEALVAQVGSLLRETLAGVGPLARPGTVSIAVETDGRDLTVVVVDESRGVPDGVRRGEPADAERRAGRYGGQLTVEPSGEGRRLTWSIPVT